MTPERWTDDRLDDLAHQVRAVASVASLVAGHTAKLDALDDESHALRDAQRDATAEFRRVLSEFDRACEKKVERFEKAMDEQAKQVDTLTRAQRWTPTQWTAIITTGIAALGTLVGIVLTRAPT